MPARKPGGSKAAEELVNMVAAAAAAADTGLIRTVDVQMGPLGDFEVKVYADGFIVRSKKDGSVVEISNIGKAVVLVQDSKPSETGSKTSRGRQGRSKTVIATTSGQVFVCRVLLVDSSWERLTFLPFFLVLIMLELLNYELPRADLAPSLTSEWLGHSSWKGRSWCLSSTKEECVVCQSS
jgi:hypothetical protein